MDAADDGDLVEGASADPAEKAKGKATVVGRRANEGRRSLQRERMREMIVHLKTEMDDEDLQVGVLG
ncbi:hypothetical protein Scep_026765 [Stephania cephalantha]|uniref:Uncharacterized protein n=1 Tax=Stephania cephalantha TaxID=152367 RepID=A0AAP0HSW6_9MAGN